MDYAVAAQLVGVIAFIVSFFGLMGVVLFAQFGSEEPVQETVAKVEPTIEERLETLI